MNDTTRRRFMATAAATASGALLPSLAHAQASANAAAFPIKGKPIRVIVSFPPGAGPDALARLALPKMSEALGQNMYIENRPGGGTVISAQEVIRSAPDGHTLFFSASSTFCQAPHTLKTATYDPIKAFTPISMGATGPLVLIVNKALGVNNIKELLAWGKANPNNLSYGSFGMGTSSHIYGEIFKKKTGLALEHIPYKGGAEMVADLTEGRLPFAFDAAPQAIQTEKTGKAKIIAIAAPQRSALMPGVGTFTEQGLSDMDLTSFIAWFGPAGMSPATVKKINEAVRAACAVPELQAGYKESAYIAEWSTPEQLAESVKKAYVDWGNLVKIAGIQKS